VPGKEGRGRGGEFEMGAKWDFHAGAKSKFDRDQ